jgi:hypothetical protein
MRFTAFLEIRLNPGTRGLGDIEGLGGTGGSRVEHVGSKIFGPGPGPGPATSLHA